MFYEVWKDVSYDHINNILMIDTDVYVQMKDSKHKKTDKINIWIMKTVLVEFQNFSIYQLYDQKKNEIIISFNVSFNKDFMSDSLEKIDNTIVRETLHPRSKLNFHVAVTIWYLKQLQKILAVKLITTTEWE